MKTTIITFIISLIGLNCIGQEKYLKISTSIGSYYSPSFSNVTSGLGKSLDMSYYFKKNLFISSHVNYGQFRFFKTDTNITDYSIYADGTNSKANEIHVGLLIGKKFTFQDKINLHGAIGISTYTQMQRFPFQFDISTYGYINSAFTDLAFPVRFGLDYDIWKNFSIGIISGFYIEPDFPIVGFHIGPAISYKI